MNISDLFENLQENLIEELKGELTLDGNCIIWSFDIKENVNHELESFNDADDADDVDYDEFSFIINSTSETLQEAYDEDIVFIERLIDELDILDDWTFSDAEVWENNISFKIF